MNIKPGMQFIFYRYGLGSGKGMTLFVVATADGWLCQQSKSEFDRPSSYVVPDKGHLTNPYSFWDVYSYGEIDEDAHKSNPHQYEAWREWQRERLNKDPVQETPPYVDGIVSSDGTSVMVEHCPHCDKSHIHGYTPGVSHRRSHCKGDKRSLGYYVYVEDHD